MPFGDYLKDSLAAAFRHPGNSSATLADFRARRRKRKLQDFQRIVGRKAVDKYLEVANKGPRQIVYQDSDLVIKTQSGWSRDHRCKTTDILIFPRDNSGNRLHIVYDERGNEILNEWHEQ